MFNAVYAESRPTEARPHLRADLSENGTAFLNHLRMSGLSCRSAARTDVFEACAVLASDGSTARQASADVLMKCLSTLLGRQPVLYRPGEQETSFDEVWLMSMVEAIERDDIDSLTFLLRSRLPREACRNVGFLIRSVSEHFRQI